MAELEGPVAVIGSDLVLSQWENETWRRGDFVNVTNQVRAGMRIQSLCAGPLDQEPLH